MAKSSTFTRVFMAGSGFMGRAIAFLIVSRTNASVELFDVSEDSLKLAAAEIEKYGRKSVEKGILTEKDFADAKGRIHYSGDLQSAKDCDLVIEAIREDLETKRELFSKLDSICGDTTVFASNTSSLPITSLASATKRSDRFIGMHFFSPAHVMKLVEIIPGVDTSTETIDRVRKFGEEMGKTIIKSLDFPGFITTRLGMVLINEAAFALMEGLSTPEEIDTGMTLGYNHPMGPLTLADFIGLDVVLHIMETMQSGFGDTKYRPCPVLRQLVSAGHLGRKTGKGFYDYGGKG
ncbi:MAG: 3-hydroxyacyl-CoA dehydrogenase NAD-binding domain-containing protein [Cyanobacteriota/Melainabacteria group bacterium]|nr:3-hydroxybutyryl-CoA dehydrogenase [Cyanobacteria bacterium HKST-UBA01]MCB9471430.1 3-hydroxybutyryl-CoA dehydrogenase [Candidatus Obscuribacterales bacterium]